MWKPSKEAGKRPSGHTSSFLGCAGCPFGQHLAPELKSSQCWGLSGPHHGFLAVRVVVLGLEARLYLMCKLLFLNHLLAPLHPFFQVVFLLCAYITVYFIYGTFRKTFDRENDTFRVEFLLVPVIGLSFLENYSFTPLEVGEEGSTEAQLPRQTPRDPSFWAPPWLPIIP